ncbi:glycosyltransferase [Alphaproteobacteria bacterium]|nr:glycosyltransferase [Alphaproteobacteria bacterium]
MCDDLKVSIITVVLNRSDVITNCIESVVSQDYLNIEHIIIDGGSQDGTLNLIKPFLSQHVKLFSEKDDGLYFAINKGINLATGSIIGLLHSDDVFASQHTVSKVIKEFKNSNCSAVYGDVEFFRFASGGRKVITRRWQASAYKKTKLKLGWMPPHTSLFIKKSVYKELGVFDTSYEISADYDFIFRMLMKNYKVNYLPSVLVQMGIGGKSTASFQNQIIKFKEDFRVIQSNNVGNLGTIILKRLRKLNQYF